MGTRSLIHFHDEPEDLVLVTVYRQFDGYPEARGLELAEFLASKEMCNGIPVGTDTSRLANGMGCLAAQWIALEKESPGNVYIYPPGATDCWEEFVYHVRITGSGSIQVEVESVYDGSIYFKGAPAELISFIQAKADSDE